MVHCSVTEFGRSRKRSLSIRNIEWMHIGSCKRFSNIGRTAMRRFKIADLRLIFENDVRFLEQF